MIEIKRGMDLPIVGAPEPKIESAPHVRYVALVGDDYVGLKPSFAVREGDSVKLGQSLFIDKKVPGVPFTSPGTGTVLAVNRGAKRKFQSIVIELEGEEEVEFVSFADRNLDHVDGQEVRDNLVQSGLWTALRTRPYSKIPTPDATPQSIFVTAIDTNPLAPPPLEVISDQAGSFERGLQVLGRLADRVFVCTGPDIDVPGADFSFVQVEQFAGPHPAGLPGTHIHFLDPVSSRKTVWYVHYQDVIAMGKLFATGRIPVDRVISLAGPAALRPRLLRTRLGASIEELVEGETHDVETRVLSGSPLSGRAATGPFAFLGRYHVQVALLEEGRQRVLFDWLRPGTNRFSVINAFASAISPKSRRYPFTTSQEGSRRAMVPIGMYEKVMPLDILPTSLLRALIVGDTDQAQALGCLELDEEDLALCGFVCPGKYEFGPLLRHCLSQIEEEG